jgi:hypothetical protein
VRFSGLLLPLQKGLEFERILTEHFRFFDILNLLIFESFDFPSFLQELQPVAEILSLEMHLLTDLHLAQLALQFLQYSISRLLCLPYCF